MSSHPKTFFGPAIICEKFTVEDEEELYACFNEDCNRYKEKYRKGTFCDKCGWKLEKREVKVQVQFEPYTLEQLSEFRLEHLSWYNGHDKSDYYIGNHGIHIDNDYEEVEHIVTGSDHLVQDFKSEYAAEIELLNKTYNGKSRIELILLNRIR